jgi:hypothetical protein
MSGIARHEVKQLPAAYAKPFRQGRPRRRHEPDSLISITGTMGHVESGRRMISPKIKTLCKGTNRNA